MARITYVLFALLSVLATGFSEMMMQEKVPVSVYYESLCPDSIKFFTSQLYPTWSNMSQYMNLTLVPYGKATQTKMDDGKYKFECHHGQNECIGNTVQICAIKNIPSQNDQMKFINCVMSMTATNKSEPYPGPQCSSSVGINDYAPIQNCSNSDTGNMLLAEYGNMTMELEPKLTSVPSIVFNNKYMPNEQDKYRTEFKAALCQHIMGKKPEECKNTKSSGITNIPGAGIISFFTVISIILTSA